MNQLIWQHFNFDFTLCQRICNSFSKICCLHIMAFTRQVTGSNHIPDKLAKDMKLREVRSGHQDRSCLLTSCQRVTDIVCLQERIWRTI